MPITYEFLKQNLILNEEEGRFYWSKKGHGRPLGKRPAGYIEHNGYRRIKIKYTLYGEHQLVWLWFHKVWPTSQIDHINQNKSDNRICNLRLVNTVVNSQNRKMAINNTSGFTGVSFNKLRQKYDAAIHVNKKKICLGSFKNIEDAISSRKAANVKYGFHPNHGSKKF